MSGDLLANRNRAIAALIAAYDGNATVALLDLAYQAGIAVSYEDRLSVEARLGRALTDAEWERAKPHLVGYTCGGAVNAGADETVAEWVTVTLPHLAGIQIEGA